MKEISKKDFFLSHSSMDKSFVKKVASELTKVGVKVWLDEWDILPGGNIVKEINKGLENSEFLLVFLSSKSIESRWVEEEWTKKVYEEIDSDRITVIPILIDDLNKDKIPIILKGKKYLTFSDGKLAEIDKLVSMVRKIKKEEVESTELDVFKDMIIKMNKKGNYKTPVFQNLILKLKRVSNWDEAKRLKLIQTEVEFASISSIKREEEMKKKYDEEPSQFNFWGQIAFGADKELLNFRDKLLYVLGTDLTDEEKYSQIILDIEMMAEKENK